ncbi:MAG TPA: ribokinase [Terracidiphilus sp.]|nr:ribokinase [Terracidiphilus sp.]
MANKSIVVVGSLNFDLVVQVERIPRIGETVLGTRFQTHPGGKGANQAAEIGRLDHPVHLIGRIGSDAFGMELLQSLKRVGVDMAAVSVSPGASGIAIIEVQTGGDNSIVVAPGANANLSGADLDDNFALIRNARLVLTQLEIPISTLEHLAQMCEREGVPLILDPAPACALSSQVLSRVSWITPNETEALLLTGNAQVPATEPELRELAELLMAMGPRNVLLKLGERGAYVATEEGLRAAIPAYPVKAVDTTAAGDAFNGAFAVALARGSGALVAARFATAAAAISVTRHGALPSMPTTAEVEAFMAAHEEVTL